MLSWCLFGLMLRECNVVVLLLVMVFLLGVFVMVGLVGCGVEGISSEVIFVGLE